MCATLVSNGVWVELPATVRLVHWLFRRYAEIMAVGAAYRARYRPRSRPALMTLAAVSPVAIAGAEAPHQTVSTRSA